MQQQQQFEIRVRRADGTVVVELIGELDIASAPDLRDILIDLVVEKGERGVVLDLTELDFIDSTGLSVFIEVHKRLASVGGDLVFLGARPPVTKVLEITGLARVLRLEPA